MLASVRGDSMHNKVIIETMLVGLWCKWDVAQMGGRIGGVDGCGFQGARPSPQGCFLLAPLWQGWAFDVDPSLFT